MTTAKYDRDHIAQVIVRVIATATENGELIDTQEDLTLLVNEALQAEGVEEGFWVPQWLIDVLMYRATAKSKRMYPGQCIQKTYAYGYRITDRQLWEEVKVSRGRLAASITKRKRAIAEMEVKKRGPEAKAVIAMMKSSLSTDEDALAMLDEWIVAEA